MIENIRFDLKKAMKEGKKDEVNALRNLVSRLKSKEIEKGSPLNDDESLKVCLSAAKQIKDSIDQFHTANRMDLVEKEQIELNIIKNYLPEQLSDEEIISIIRKVIQNTGASSPADMGKVMGPIMKEISGKSDGKIVQKLVIKELSS